MIDTKIIALTFELHKNNEGTSTLRNEPVPSQIIASKENPESKTKLLGFYEGKLENDLESQNIVEQQSIVDFNDSKEIEFTENEGTDLIDNESSEDESIAVIQSLNEIKLDEKADELLTVIKNSDIEKNILKKETDLLDNEGSEDESIEVLQSLNEIKSDEEPDESENSENENDLSNEDSDNESDWITPSKIKELKKGTDECLEEVPIVACMTTDFALQNVLKQINLNICALDGRVIKYLKTYILRCYSCFKTTSIMTKIFCPNCGNKTLKRVSVSLDKDGKQVIHINTKRPLTRKYKNQSLPRPQGGKHSRNPIVVEDQPIPRQNVTRVAKTKTQPLNEDYIAGYSPFATRDLNSKSALLRSRGHLKEWAQNNSFEEQRRKKHFNRLVK